MLIPHDTVLVLKLFANLIKGMDSMRHGGGGGNFGRKLITEISSAPLIMQSIMAEFGGMVPENEVWSMLQL